MRTRDGLSITVLVGLAGSVLAACTGGHGFEDVAKEANDVIAQGDTPDWDLKDIIDFDARMNVMRETEADIEEMLKEIDELQATVASHPNGGFDNSPYGPINQLQIREDILKDHLSAIKYLITNPDRLNTLSLDKVSKILHAVSANESSAAAFASRI